MWIINATHQHACSYIAIEKKSEYLPSSTYALDGNRTQFVNVAFRPIFVNHHMWG